ncbi:PadR family transcriptional regulator [Actinopolymorpha alba]|uniref:PadR family transcriptional regulator n=1 Tax=Actinopolymorpha alba TaxID=533267 RepID=UPI00036DAC1C|nr:PadR family transcriptional regulator [Actinopolymorpha alba]
MTRRKVSNPLALAVLSLLRERPMHPYEMSRTLRQRNKEGSIRLNYGSLYSVVDKLMTHGLIESQETVREGQRPERTIYRATPAGQAEFEDWLAELLSTPVKEYTQFEAGLSLLPGLPPDEVANLLERRCEHLEETLAASDAVLGPGGADLPRLYWIEWDYVRAHLETDLAWTRRLVRDIRDGSLEGIGEWRRFHTTDADSDARLTSGENPAPEGDPASQTPRPPRKANARKAT